MDNLSKEERSTVMGKVKSKNTKAELTVRRLLFSLGYRYRLNAKDIPGHPDIVFRSRKKVIFVHGCFWHRHDCFNGQRVPKSRVEFWVDKFEKNQQRDKKVAMLLEHLEWKYLIIWECEIKKTIQLTSRLKCFLEERIECHVA